MAASGGGSDDEVVIVGGGLAERRVASVKMGTWRTGLRDLEVEKMNDLSRNRNGFLALSFDDGAILFL